MSCNCQEIAEKGKKKVEESLKIPFAAHESEVSRLERIIKRQWILIIILICGLVGCFAWQIQFETVEENTTEKYAVEQDTEVGNNNCIIKGGEIRNAETDDYLHKNNNP